MHSSASELTLNDGPIERPPDLWDQGCATDEIRNDFVIPAILDVASTIGPSSIIDIGCGSGYVAREIVARGAANEIHWRLLDYAGEMLSFARMRVSSAARTEFFLHDLRYEPRDLPKSQLGFVAYTFLDFPLDDVIAHNIASLIATGGTLLIFMPDVLEDVIEAAAQDPTVLHNYRSGHCSIEKTDKFTFKNVLFEANRVENTIQRFLRAYFTLTDLKNFRSKRGKLHYMLTFRAM